MKTHGPVLNVAVSERCRLRMTLPNCPIEAADKILRLAESTPELAAPEVEWTIQPESHLGARAA